MHACHARGCKTEIPPRLFMCPKHWRMLPKVYQRAVWRAYRPGQEVDKRPSTIYLQITRDAINVVHAKEQSQLSGQGELDV